MQSRNEECECGSNKKFKNCCMKDTGASFIRKYGYKIVFLILTCSFITMFYNKIANAEPTVWCYECQKWVPEDSTGHQLEPLSE